MSERFKNRLAVSLTLTIDGREFKVSGGDIKELRFDLRTWGFTARAVWWTVLESISQTDDLAAPFVTGKGIEVSLSLDRAFDKGGEEASPLVLRGVVRDKTYQEKAFDAVEGYIVLHRRYEIWFQDTAAVLWGHHFPTQVYVDKSLQELISDHLPEGVTVNSEWSGYTRKRGQQAFALGNAPSRADAGASFYDLLQWLLDNENAALRYSVADGRYAIVEKKSSEGEVYELPFDDYASVTVYFKEPTRHLTNVLNGSSVASAHRKQGSNEDADKGIRREVLIVSPLSSSLNDRSTLEVARYGSQKPMLRGDLAHYPTIGLEPDMRVTFGDGWSDKLFQSGVTYRVQRMAMDAIAEVSEATDSSGDDSNIYAIDYQIEFETADDPIFQYPRYRVPIWPFMVEGTVVSEQGEEDQGTYQTYTDSETSMNHHKVKLPLFSDGGADLVVVVPYDIGSMPGHFYFPAIRGERVEVSFTFDTARITRFLDWRAGARLAQETQGNQILLGKKERDETSIQHVYADNLPKLSIRRTSSKDVQTVTIEEGKMTIEVFEEQGES